MAQAGITHIQPGIESLSSHVLRLMRKGIRAIQNVNLLRWARYYGIHVEWNLLWGFPGETERDYADQAAVMPHLRHLRPPGGTARIRMERFSPIFTEPDTFQLRHREPERSYRYVYPDYVDHERVAYFFDYELDGGLPDGTYADVRRAVGDWSASLAGWQPAGVEILVRTSFHPDLRRPDSEGRKEVTRLRTRSPTCTWHASTGPRPLPRFADHSVCACRSKVSGRFLKSSRGWA